MHSTHYFFALTLPPETRGRISEVCERVKEEYPFKNWVHPEDYHITLAFLGNADGRRLTAAVDNVKEALKAFHSIQVGLNQMGTFGRPDSPRILWVNTTDSPSLQEVRQKVFVSCEKAGFELETRPFKPHITVARKWMGQGRFHLNTAEQSVSSLLPGPLFSITEAVLYRTHPDRSPKYEKVESFRLI